MLRTRKISTTARFPRRRLAAATAMAAAGALALAGCSGSSDAAEAPSSSAAVGKHLSVVTSTSVYQSIVSHILGDQGDVTALITSAAQDPHSYEATSRDKLTVSKADLVVLNGGGYDTFAEQMAGAGSDVMTAFDLVGPAETPELAEGEKAPTEVDGHEPNEHLWYDLNKMEQLVPHLVDELGKLDPAGVDGFKQRGDEFTAQLKDMQSSLADIAKTADGRSYMMTEPVPQALLDQAGLKDATPDGLAEAVEEGDEIAPLTMKQATDLLGGKTEVDGKKVAVFAYNKQTADEQTASLGDAAKSGGVPELDVVEAPPAGTDYIEWMTSNIDNLAACLK